MNSHAKLKAIATAVIGLAWFSHLGTAAAAVQVVSNANFSISYNDATRFGTATLIGNALSFDLVSTASPATPWVAESLNGAGVVTSNSTVALTLKINDAAYASGYRFSAFDWLEGGDYFLKEASSSVSVLGQLRAINQALPLVTTTTKGLTVLAPGLTTVASNTDWFAIAKLDAATSCGGPGCLNVFSTQPQEMLLTIENRLSASTTGANTQGFIEKKLGAGAFTLQVTAVPEASTWVMMLAGLGAVGFVASRRRA